MEQEGEGEAAAEPKPKEPMVAQPLRILEGLAASGLRALRYAQEVRVTDG